MTSDFKVQSCIQSRFQRLSGRFLIPQQVFAPMVKYRDHRGSLEASMATVQEMNSLDDLRQHLASDPIQPLTGDITIEFYAHDPRIDWDAHVVCVDGNAVGFTDGTF